MSSAALDTGGRLGELRDRGASAFAELGLPTGKQEEWRHSNPRPLAGLERPAPPRPTELHVAGVDIADAGARVFLVDGHFFVEPRTAIPGGASVSSLVDALASGHPATSLVGQLASPEARSLTAVNTASLDDGVVLDVGAGVNLSRPLHVVQVTRPHRVAAHPRVVVRVGAGARATLIESFVGGGTATVTNGVTEIELEAGASLEHLRWVRGRGAHVGCTHVVAERDARYRVHAASAGTELAREEIQVCLRGDGAHTSIGGLMLGRADQLVDHQVRVEHAAASTTSEQLFKSILDDRATGSFAGTVVVRAGARGTDARQTSRALLLGERARANAKPQLEIYTDDVRCTHGSTSGQLDDDALFYLRTRGLGEAAARDLLTLAFAGEWFERVRDPELREAVGGWVRAWLEEGRP